VVSRNRIIDKSFDAITSRHGSRLEKAEKDRLRIEPRLTRALQKILQTDEEFEWELIAAKADAQSWSDFKDRSIVWRPVAGTVIDDVFVVSHFNENLFNQYSFGVLLEKPPYNFIDREARRHVDEYGSIRVSEFHGKPFNDLIQFGEAVIALKTTSHRA
jgi:hypothetical protein